MNNIWSFHDEKVKELKQLYDRMSKQTQNDLQKVFDTFNFSFDNLYDIADTKTKKKADTIIEEYQDKGLLKGYFGILAKNIYIRKKVKNNEILELLIYGAYIEEQNKLDEQEKRIMYEDANYYYEQGQQEVNKKEKSSIIPMALFLALLDQPLYNGYTFEQNIEVAIRNNVQQIYKQCLINIVQNKENNIDNIEFQNIIKRQQSTKLNINGEKMSGNMDLIMIGLNNKCIVEGIKTIDKNAKVQFISDRCDNVTPMCMNMDRMIFNVNDYNDFTRYIGTSIKDVRQEKLHVFGLVQGINMPPINNFFHWCHSYLIYVKSIEEKSNKWYNKLGNSNKNGTGGNGKGTFIEKIDLKDKDKKIQEYEEQIRNMKSEFAVIIDTEGNIYAYQGSKTNLDITDRKLDNTIVTHNHTEIGSFGKDDFELLKTNNKIKELRAVDSEYNYSLKILKDIDVTYNEIYVEGAQLAFETGDDIQHCTMEILKERGYIKYERRRKRES